MAQKELMELDNPIDRTSSVAGGTNPVTPPAVTLPEKAPAVGSDAMAKTGTASRDLMPVTEQTVQRETFQPPTPAATIEPQTSSVTDKETVSGQLRELMSADSPYLEQGRQAGLAQASRRGLQNSSLAIQAGEQGRIAAALPIAQQDAATQAQRAELNQNTVNEFRANELDHVQSLVERAQQGDINAQLQLDQYGFSSALSAQQNLEQMEQRALAGDIEASQRYLDFSYNTILAGIEQGYALQLNDQQFQNSQRILQQEFDQALGISAQDSQERINELNAQHQNTLEEIAARTDAATDEREANLGFQLQGQYLAEVAARQQAASEEIRIIMQTEGLSAVQQNSAVSQARNRLNADIAALQAYYSYSPQWDDDFGPAPLMMPTPPTVTPRTPPGTRVPGNNSYYTRPPGSDIDYVEDEFIRDYR